MRSLTRVNHPTLLLSLLALTNPAHAAEHFEGWSFYLGDPHAHTGASTDGGSLDLGATSDSYGAVADLRENAQAAGLDWLAVTDHVTGPWAADADDFDVVWQTVLDAHDPEGGFVTLPGAELWHGIEGELVGHKNLYMFPSNADLRSLTVEDLQWRGRDTEIGSCDDIRSHVAELEARWGQSLLIPHHPAFVAGMGTTWACHTGEQAQHYAPAVEVYSEHGNSMGLDGWDPLWKDTDPERTVDWVLSQPELGQRLGFMAGTDSHDTWPGTMCQVDQCWDAHPYAGGLTIAMIPEGEPFDRADLHDAMVERRTYATTGPLVPAVISFRTGGVVLGGMGEELLMPPDQQLEVELLIPTAWERFVLSVTLHGKDYHRELSALRGGVYHAMIEAEDVPPYLYASVTLDGAAHYGTEGCADGGADSLERIWLSPTWFDAGEGDLDGDGYGWPEGDCDDGDPSVHPAADEDCGSGQDEDCDGLVDLEDPECSLDTGTVVLPEEDTGRESGDDGRRGCSALPGPARP